MGIAYRYCLLICVSLLFSTLIPAFSGTPSDAPLNEVVLWAVWPPKTKREPKPTVDTIVVLKNGKFESPEDNDAIANEHRIGQELHLFFGGQAVGTARVLGPADQGCSGSMGEVDLSNSFKLKDGQYALASNSDNFHSHRAVRRSINPAERQILADLAARYYASAGLNPSLLKKIKIREAVATSIDSSNRINLIATITLRAPKAIHQIFVVARKHKNGYRFDLVNPYVQRDLVDEKDSQYEQYVDQLDVDGDGRDELITVTWYYENNDYRIYKRYPDQDGWYVFYTGGGGGC